MKWKDFSYAGQVYGLSHLTPFSMELERPAKDNRPAATFKVDVQFSFHCFTSKLPTEPFDPKLKYADAREVRVFNFERYELSRRLPEIVRSLRDRKCLHTGRGNFVTVDMVANDGSIKKYHVFFEVSKSAIKGRLNLYIQSSYVPDRDVSHAKMPMNFLYILHNTLHQIPVRS